MHRRGFLGLVAAAAALLVAPRAWVEWAPAASEPDLPAITMHPLDVPTFKAKYRDWPVKTDPTMPIVFDPDLVAVENLAALANLDPTVFALLKRRIREQESAEGATRPSLAGDHNALAHASPLTPRGEASVAGALFDFLGFLTSREQAITLSGGHDAVPAIEALREWAQTRGLDLDHADVLHWHGG